MRKHNRTNFGYAYSSPVNADENPIESTEQLLDFFTLKFGESDYIISKELHENGKNHFMHS